MENSGEPTKEQRKELWEWCGLKRFWNHNPYCDCGAKDDDDSRRSWHYKDGDEWKLATRFWSEDMTVDLNSLFLYVMPILLERGWNIHIHIDSKTMRTKVVVSNASTTHLKSGKDIVQTFLRAIWGVIHGK